MANKQEEIASADPVAYSKYTFGGSVVNKVLQALLLKCEPGASVRDICIEGDKLIEEEVQNVYKKEKDLKRGIAFPVCLSVNNCINHYSPLTSDADTILEAEDVVKIDFGAHIDGYISVVGHTHIVGAVKGKKITGRKADVMLAAHYAMEASLKLLKPGNNNYQITKISTKVAEAFKCKPIEGMLSFQLKQGSIDGEKTIVQNPNEAQRKEVSKCDFEKHEAYAIDVLISTGEGVGREMDSRVTIYRKTEENYSLRLKTSREFFSKVKKNHGAMPFNIRSFEDEKKARMGVVECVTHNLVEQYPVVWEKPKEIVAQFKYTVLLKAIGQTRVTGLPFCVDDYESEYKIEDPEILKLVKVSASKNKNKNKKKAAAPKETSNAKENSDPKQTSDKPSTEESK